MKNGFIAPIGKHAREEKKYPEYLQAVEDFLAANPTEGEIVTHEWLDEHLDLRPGTDGYAMRKMSRVQGFRKELLEKHQVDLKNVLGKGYYVVRQSSRPQPQCVTQETASTVHTGTAFPAVSTSGKTSLPTNKKKPIRWLLQFLPD